MYFATPAQILTGDLHHPQKGDAICISSKLEKGTEKLNSVDHRNINTVEYSDD